MISSLYALLSTLFLIFNFSKANENVGMYDKHFKQGMDHLQAKRYNTAISSFNAAIKQIQQEIIAKPNSISANDWQNKMNVALTKVADSFHLQGVMYVRSKQYEDAISSLLRALKKGKNTPDVFVILADAYNYDGQFEKAKQNYLNALNKSSPSHDLHPIASQVGPKLRWIKQFLQRQKQFQPNIPIGKRRSDKLKEYWNTNRQVCWKMYLQACDITELIKNAKDIYEDDIEAAQWEYTADQWEYRVQLNNPSKTSAKCAGLNLNKLVNLQRELSEQEDHKFNTLKRIHEWRLSLEQLRTDIHTSKLN